MHLKPSNRFLRMLHSDIHRKSEPRENVPAMVFAPHPDDEVLGCGGTIILKRNKETLVSIVFMTDGRTSHQRFVNSDELCRIRREEALDAGSALGVEEQNLHFLDFPDGELDHHHVHAVTRVMSLLSSEPVGEVFVPYQWDGTPDHEATYRIVQEAVRRLNLKGRFFEYPVWMWNQWPWVSLELRPNRNLLRDLKALFHAGFGLRARNKLRSGVFVGEVLSQKREALSRHRSQTTELQPGVGWPTLSDVSNGEFLNCFFQEYELFCCRDSSTL